MYDNLVQCFVGVVLALILIFVASTVRFLRDISFLPTVLSFIAGYYVLFAFLSGESLILESLIAIVFISLSVYFGIRVPKLLGGLYISHVLIDLLHLNLIKNSSVPSWWIPFCIGFDVAIGVFLIFFFDSGNSLLKGEKASS